METTKTKRALLAAVALVAVGFTACDNENDVVDDPAPSTVHVEDALTGEDGYLDALDQFAVSTPDDALTIALGEQVCIALDEGNSVGSVVVAMTGPDGLSGMDAGYVLGASTLFLCPEHLAAAQEWSEA